MGEIIFELAVSVICAFAAFFRASRLACFGLLELILRVFPLD